MVIRRLVALVAVALAGCTGVPEGVETIGDFDLERYLGTWYEIARLDHRFERGLTNVEANYSRRADGGIRVVNRGYDPRGGAWQEAVGKAYPIGEEGQGRLKVSFFGPFYASYNIIALDPGYRYAMVTGPDRSYLWILAREPALESEVLKGLIAQAAELGYATGELIFPQQAVAE